MPRTRPLVVFVPGLGVDGAAYEPLLGRLRKRYDVRTADLPLEFPDELDWEFFFGAIEAVAPRGEPVYLLGHSLGGAVALKYAAAHPRRVAAVIAISPVLFPFRRHRRRWWERIRNFTTALLAGQLLHLVRVTRILRQRAGGGRSGKLYRFSRTIDLRADLPTLPRAVILWPEREEIIPASHIRSVRNRFPNITVITVPGSHQSASLAPRRLGPIIEREIDAFHHYT